LQGSWQRAICWDFLKRKLGARGVARLTVTGDCRSLPDDPYRRLAIFIGFAWSAGVSIGFPSASAAAGLDDTHEAQNIATMAMIAMSGFLSDHRLSDSWLRRSYCESLFGLFFRAYSSLFGH
jgi:hypothetical protein